MSHGGGGTGSKRAGLGDRLAAAQPRAPRCGCLHGCAVALGRAAGVESSDLGVAVPLPVTNPTPRAHTPPHRRLDKLRNVAGVAAPAATSLDDVLEGDFDPEEWDKKMAAAFNDDYYDVSGGGWAG